MQADEPLGTGSLIHSPLESMQSLPIEFSVELGESFPLKLSSRPQRQSPVAWNSSHICAEFLELFQKQKTNKQKTNSQSWLIGFHFSIHSDFSFWILPRFYELFERFTKKKKNLENARKLFILGWTEWSVAPKTKCSRAFHFAENFKKKSLSWVDLKLFFSFLVRPQNWKLSYSPHWTSVGFVPGPGIEGNPAPWMGWY